MNAKNLIQFLVTAFVLAFAATATAQTIPEASTQLPPKMAACLRACLASGAEPSATPSCGNLNDIERGKIAQMQKDIAALKSQVAALQKKYAELKARLDGIDEKDAERDKKIAQLRADFDALLKSVEGLQTAYRLTLETMVAADIKLGGEILRLQQDLKALDSRVADLEASRPKIGPRAGVIVLPALDGTTYTGIPVVARLTLSFNKRTWLALDGGASFTFSDSPVGAYGRAGVGYDFHPNWYVTGGVGTLWAGYNDKLKAKASYLPFDAGLGYRNGVFDASLNLLAGPKFGLGGTSFALGGTAMVGLSF